MQSPYLFISHSTRDTDETNYLAERLEKAGYRCWVDVTSIPDGSTWARVIQSGVEACAAFIVVMTANGRASEWVERETLLALDLRKPVFIARFDETPLPIHLISRQASDFRKRRETAMTKLLGSIEAALAAPPAPPPTSVQVARISPDPNEHNFFKYVEQLPNGEENARIARALYRWAVTHADNITFSGRASPAFHAHLYIGFGGVLACSVRAYPKQPVIEIPLQYFTEFPPYDNADVRLAALAQMNALLPADEQLDPSRADRRPTLPLVPTLSDPAAYEQMEQLLTTLFNQLRGR